MSWQRSLTQLCQCVGELDPSLFSWPPVHLFSGCHGDRFKWLICLLLHCRCLCCRDSILVNYGLNFHFAGDKEHRRLSIWVQPGSPCKDSLKADWEAKGKGHEMPHSLLPLSRYSSPCLLTGHITGSWLGLVHTSSAHMAGSSKFQGTPGSTGSNSIPHDLSW